MQMHTLPVTRKQRELEQKYGVPIEWLLETMHHTLKKSVNTMSNELGVARPTIGRWMDAYDIDRRGRSEAESVKWDQMSEEQRQAQVEAAHETLREKYENGNGTLQRWYREDPERAREHARRVARLGTPARSRNGMEGKPGTMRGVTGPDHPSYGIRGEDHPMFGVTGQDNPNWRGGKSIYDAIKKQLGQESWDTVRARHRGGSCEMCDGSDSLHLHHTIPLLAGGTNEPWNLMTLCLSCHTTVEGFTRSFADSVFVE